MLSLKNKGSAIADIVYKDKKKNKTVYLYDGDDSDDEDKKDIDQTARDEILPKSFYSTLRNINSSHLILLKKAIRDSNKGILHSDYLKSCYDQSQILLGEILKKYIEIPKKVGHIEVLPSKTWQGHMLVSGASGAGKSTFIGNYIFLYSKLNPKNEIFIFSPILDDPAYKDIKNVHYVKLDGSIIDEPLSVDEFKSSKGTGTILLFDDIESIKEKGLSENIEHFRDSALMTGRHCNIEVICVSHVLLNTTKSKVPLTECGRVVLYPKSGFQNISNYLRRYLGFSRDDINYVKDIRSRWVCILRNYPTTIISEQSVKVI